MAAVAVWVVQIRGNLKNNALDKIMRMKNRDTWK